LTDILNNGSTEIRITIKQMPYVEMIKEAASQLSKGYDGNLKIEINIQKVSGEVKCNVTEYDL